MWASNRGPLSLQAGGRAAQDDGLAVHIKGESEAPDTVSGFKSQFFHIRVT
jgi:hypothetical protein